jgi:glycosylphosphatidylinositol deacylase
VSDFSTSVEFNEDLSALHGPTIDSQVSYSSSAISYILSQYPPGTTIIVIGHSMGGIVATSLLPSKNISTIITMSTPHVLPPARFDSRIDRIYEVNHHTLLSDPTPIISLCGGAADMMIISESCILPMLEPNVEVYRKTVFTTALEGAWSGVGHREMVWCHQVRWRVAKAALELDAAHSAAERGLVLDTWLRDGQIPSQKLMTNTEALSLTDPGKYEILPAGDRLVLRQPRGPSIHLLPIVQSPSPAKLLLFVSQGSIPPVSPYHPLPLRISVHLCNSASVGQNTHPRCVPLDPETLKLIPNPVAGTVYPTPEEGADESEGVVLFEAEIPPAQDSERRWLAVIVESADGRGWVVGGLESNEELRLDAGTLSEYTLRLSN